MWRTQRPMTDSKSIRRTHSARGDLRPDQRWLARHSPESLLPGPHGDEVGDLQRHLRRSRAGSARCSPSGWAPWSDRSKEHLGAADSAVIALRHILIKAARDLESGEEPSRPTMAVARLATWVSRPAAQQQVPQRFRHQDAREPGALAERAGDSTRGAGRPARELPLRHHAAAHAGQGKSRRGTPAGVNDLAGFFDNPRFKSGDFGLFDINMGNPAIKNSRVGPVLSAQSHQAQARLQLPWVRASRDRAAHGPRRQDVGTVHSSSISIYSAQVCASTASWSGPE